MAKIDPISGFPEFLPAQQLAFDHITSKIAAIYQSFGYVPLETAAVERIDTLVSKGVDSKEVYALRRLNAQDGDDGSKELALRFDLTVPLARYVAQNYANLVFPFRRYQCQPVWRGERPQHGRYRQFHQFDLDVLTDGPLPLQADAEILAAAYTALQAVLPAGTKFTMRINNRKFLQGFLKHLDFTDDKLYQAIKIIDDLEKSGKDLTLYNLTKLRDGEASEGDMFINFLITAKPQPFSTFLPKFNALFEGDSVKTAYPKLFEGRDELIETFNSIEALLGIEALESSILFDPTIARGLDYYTGTVAETRLEAAPELGSICSGGRYDNLTASLSDRNLPGVGISIGISRLAAWLMQQPPYSTMAATTAHVVVTGAAAPQVCQQLRAANIACELALGDKSPGQHFQTAQKRGIAFGIVAETADTASLRTFSTRASTELPLADLIRHLQTAA